MSDTRYIVEYFPEDSDTMETLFVEASTKDEAKQAVVNRCGAFVNIVACNLTKSSGGPGATFQPDVPVQLADDVIESPQEAVDTPVEPEPVAKAKKVKAPKDASKPAKPAKVTNASRIREQVLIAKAAEQDMQVVIDWAVANVGQTKGMAKAYVKAIWAE